MTAVVLSPVIAADSLECFEHDDRVAANHLPPPAIRYHRKIGQRRKTYHHAKLDLLTTILLFNSIIQHNVQEHLSILVSCALVVWNAGSRIRRSRGERQ